MIRFFYAIFGRRAEIGPICLLTLKGGSCIIYIRSSGVRKRIAPLFDHASFLSAMGVDFPQSPLRFPPSRGAHPRRAPFFLNPPPSVKRTVFLYAVTVLSPQGRVKYVNRAKAPAGASAGGRSYSFPDQRSSISVLSSSSVRITEESQDMSFSNLCHAAK